MARVAPALGVACCEVLELLPGGQKLQLRAGVGWKKGLVGRATVGAGPNSWARYALSSPAPVVVEDLRADTRFRSAPLLQSHRVVSGVSVIIGGRPQPFGILGAHTTEHRKFSSDDICFIQAVAALLAQAIGREEAQAALEERERACRMLAENLPGAIYRLSAGKGQKIEFFGKAARTILGFAASELRRGKYCPVESVMEPEDRPRVRRVLRQALAEGKSFAVEYRVRDRDDRIRYVLEHGAVVTNPAGRLLSVDGVILDQTEKKQAEEDLIRERAMREAIEKSVPAGIAAVGLNGRLVYVNPFLCEMVGWRKEELLGAEAPFVFWAPEERERILAHLRASLVGKHVKEPFETRFLRRDGERFWVSLVGAPLTRGKGEWHGHAAAIFDVTERKRLESHVLEISEREQRRVGQDLHDSLGQHLRGIACLGHALELNLAEESSSYAKDARRVTRLVQEAIAQTSALARGLTSLTQEADGLVSGLRQLAITVRTIYGVSCRFHCPRRVVVPDHVRATHLYRIAQEAVQNALRHGKPSRLSIRLARRGNQVELIVGDNGRGIPAPEIRRKGMGLESMSYRADIIGATLSVESTKGGTRVHCAFSTQPHTPS
ncbi:MAG: PAS domain S-box protein, partial [Acidobacteriota bacterium]